MTEKIEPDGKLGLSNVECLSLASFGVTSGGRVAHVRLGKSPKETLPITLPVSIANMESGWTSPDEAHVLAAPGLALPQKRRLTDGFEQTVRVFN